MAVEEVVSDFAFGQEPADAENLSQPRNSEVLVNVECSIPLLLRFHMQLLPREKVRDHVGGEVANDRLSLQLQQFRVGQLSENAAVIAFN